MIQRLEALRFRSLLHLERELGVLQVLTGPNGTGKSTCLDAVAFLADVVEVGIESAVRSRAPNWRDLVWRGEGDRFELALEASIPESVREQLDTPEYARCRYQVSIGRPAEHETSSVGIVEETLGLRPDREDDPDQPELFPEGAQPPETLMTSFRTRDTQTVVHKVPDGHDHFYDETGGGWNPTFRLGPHRSALANLPDDPTKFPVASWFKQYLVDRTARLDLVPEHLHQPAPPGQPARLRPNGGNLAWVVRHLEQRAPDAFATWLDDVRETFPRIADIATTVRPDDRHCYLTVEHPSGHRVHSWGLSTGTLRSLAYSIFPYAPELDGTLLIQEPEAGIHPDAVRALYRSLQLTEDLQVLATSHSPVLWEICDDAERLDFTLGDRGETRIATADA